MFLGVFLPATREKGSLYVFDFSPKLIGAVCGCLTACNAQTKNLGHNNLQLAHSTVPGRTLTNRLISNHGIEDLIEQSSLLIIFFWKKKSTPTELTRSNLSPTRYPQHHWTSVARPIGAWVAFRSILKVELYSASAALPSVVGRELSKDTVGSPEAPFATACGPRFHGLVVMVVSPLPVDPIPLVSPWKKEWFLWIGNKIFSYPSIYPRSEFLLWWRSVHWRSCPTPTHPRCSMTHVCEACKKHAICKKNSGFLHVGNAGDSIK